MKRSHMLKCIDGKVTLDHKRIKGEPFADSVSLSFLDVRFTVPDRLNVIGVSRELYDKYRYEKLLLFKEGTDRALNVTLAVAKSASAESFLATSHVKKALSLQDGDTVYLSRYEQMTYGEVFTQKVENIRENNLVISALDIGERSFELDGFLHYELYNAFTADSIIVKSSHIIIDPTLPKGTVRLNRKQRISLGLELPMFLTDEQWSLLCTELSGSEKELICELYRGDDRVLQRDIPYDKKSRAKKLIRSHFGKKISLIPVIDSVYAKKRSLSKKFFDLFVGKSTISLLARRPFENDEGLDIVRMTRSNMNLLGIDEMDKVVLGYKNNKISCRVLELDDENAFLETNRPIPTDLAIGVPIHIRERLGVLDLSSTVKVDRDTAFIFKKSINEQVVPILLTVFSTNLFADRSALISALVSVISIPLVLYINLSSKRNMRA